MNWFTILSRQGAVLGKLRPENGLGPKMGRAQIETKFQNHEINGKKSIYKINEVEKNRRNKTTYRYANKSFFMQNFRPLFLVVSPAIVLGLVRN